MNVSSRRVRDGVLFTYCLQTCRATSCGDALLDKVVDGFVGAAVEVVGARGLECEGTGFVGVDALPAGDLLGAISPKMLSRRYVKLDGRRDTWCEQRSAVLLA